MHFEYSYRSAKSIFLCSVVPHLVGDSRVQKELFKDEMTTEKGRAKDLVLTEDNLSLGQSDLPRLCQN